MEQALQYHNTKNKKNHSRILDSLFTFFLAPNVCQHTNTFSGLVTLGLVLNNIKTCVS